MAHLNKVIVWQRPDGGVSITYLDDRDKLLGESDGDFTARMSSKLQPSFSGVTPTVIEKKDIPNKRDNRNEWSLKSNKVEVDQAKVKFKEDAKKAKDDAREAVLSKLGITKDELSKIVDN